MSILGNIKKLNDDLVDSYDAVEGKGGVIPDEENSNNLAAAISSIPNSGEGAKLYAELGSNTDGALTQKAATEAIWQDYDNPDQRNINIGGYPIDEPTSGGESGRNTIIGREAFSNSNGGTAIGSGARAGEDEDDWDNTAVGIGATAHGDNSTAIGAAASVKDTSGGFLRAVSEGTALGAKTTVYNDGAVAIGAGATAESDNSVALGKYSLTTRDGEVNIGMGYYEEGGYEDSAFRILGGVYPGEDDNDAVTVKQLNDAIAALQNTVGDIDTVLQTLTSGAGV